MFENTNTIIGILVGAIVIFGTGFGVGRYIEKKSHETKQLKTELDKVQEKLAQGIKTDPEMTQWLKDNAPLVMKFISQLTKGDSK